MRRRHLAEIEDQPWLPESIRDGMTDFLGFLFALLVPRVQVVPRLELLLDRSDAHRFVDLASGAGGPWPTLYRRVRGSGPSVPEVLLTDRYPNLRAFARLEATSGGMITHCPEPVDATRVPSRLTGVRTLFTAFHHFPPGVAREILADAVRARQPIGVFEATERTLRMLAITSLVPILVGLSTPFARPVRHSRWLWTYLLPAIPLFSLWDGWVSCLRSYSLAELRELAASVEAPEWEWRIESLPVKGLPCRVTCLLGVPEGPADSPPGSRERRAQG